MSFRNTYLVNIELALPELPADRAADLRVREAERAAELQREGYLVDIWRTVGRTANWSIWSADDNDALHAAISSLPYFPWMDITITALAKHPNALPKTTDGNVG